MPFDPNDPRLTALALGELSESERAAVEAEIADDPEAAAALAEIAATAQLLAAQFRLETEFAGNGLQPSQKQAIEDCLAGTVAPATAEPPATVPFRPSAPDKPSASPAGVPPSRSVFQLRVAAGIVAIGAIAAGVVAVRSGFDGTNTNSKFNSVATAVGGGMEPPSAKAPQKEALSRLGDFAASAGSPPSSESPPPAASEPKLESVRAGKALTSAPAPREAGAGMAGGMMGMGGGGRPGMMSGADASNGPVSDPRRLYAPAGPAAPGSADGYMRGQTSSRMGFQGQSQQAQGLNGQGQGQQGQPGAKQAQLQLPFLQSSAGQAAPSRAMSRGNNEAKVGARIEPFRSDALAGLGGSGQPPPHPAPAPPGDTPASVRAKGKTSLDASSGKAEPAEERADKAPQVDLAMKSPETAKPGQPATSPDPIPSKQPNVYNYQALSTRVKELKDIPPTAPVEVKLKADRLQREGEVVLEQLKLAEGKPDQKSRDFDGKKQDVERFGRELDVVAQQVEEARKVRVNDEEFGKVQDNAFQVVNAAPLSTFSVDVDTASYANVRRFLNQNSLPPKDAVRIEELLNYFTYDDPAPMATSKQPFSLNVESAACPWSDANRIVRVGLKGKAVADDKRPPSNLVFLVDVSGSMADLDKLPLLKAAMKLMVDNLTENDRVAIVTYANGVRVALPSTPCHRKPEILSVLEGLEAGGSTNGAGGIQRAYEIAVQSFIKGGTNRVLLATDGDFNVGISDTDELVKMIQEKAKSGVFLSVLGFGQGNLKDDKMEQLADKGNGQYSYIDSIAEARKVLVQQMGGTIVTIAKDVKVQVEFNPAKVAAYRLIGYENRMLQAQDFRDDKKDAGEIGAGLSVTALYEIVPANADPNVANNVNLRFQNAQNRGGIGSPEWLHVAIRYKAPDGDVSTEFGKDLVDDGPPVRPGLERPQVRLGRRRLRHAAPRLPLQRAPHLARRRGANPLRPRQRLRRLPPRVPGPRQEGRRPGRVPETMTCRVWWPRPRGLRTGGMASLVDRCGGREDAATTPYSRM